MLGQLNNNIHRSFLIASRGQILPLEENLEGYSLRSDRGLNYGEGLFETFAIINSSVPLWSWHRERLLSACYRLGFAVDSFHLNTLKEYISILIRELFETKTNAIGKIIVTGGDQSEGNYGAAKANLFINLVIKPSQAQNVNKECSGVDLQVCRQRISSQVALAGIKHSSRMEYCLAAKELLNKAHGCEGLLLSEVGDVIETLHHNIFLVKDNRLITPTLYKVGVRGVARRIIINDIAPSLSLPVILKDISEGELFMADEVFISNAVRGVWPAVSLNGRALSLGEVSLAIQKQFNWQLNPSIASLHS